MCEIGKLLYFLKLIKNFMHTKNKFDFHVIAMSYLHKKSNYNMHLKKKNT